MSDIIDTVNNEEFFCNYAIENLEITLMFILFIFL